MPVPLGPGMTHFKLICIQDQKTQVFQSHEVWGTCKQTGNTFSLPFFSFQQVDSLTKVAKAAKIAERMVNLNTYDDIAQGMAYWEVLLIQVSSVSPADKYLQSQQGQDRTELNRKTEEKWAGLGTCWLTQGK